MSRPSSIAQDYPLFIPYQIDFHTTTTGKHISLTKRHIRWRFGFVHLPSLLSGETGVSCRGLELEIHCIWSIASGKYVLYLNNIPFRQNVIASRLVSKFEVSFTLPETAFPGNHQVCIKAFATTVGIPAGETQFDMHFDGQRYVEFYRIFEIGGGRMLGNYGGALDTLVERGLVANSEKAQQCGGGSGDGAGGRRNDTFLKAIQPQQSQSTGNANNNGNGTDVYSIVRGRNRYRPAIGGTGVTPNLRPKSALVRSPSDPGLFENNNNNFQRQHQHHQNQHVGSNPARNPPSSNQLQRPSTQGSGSTGLSYSNASPQPSSLNFAQRPNITMQDGVQGGESSRRRTSNPNTQPQPQNIARDQHNIPAPSRPKPRTQQPNTTTHANIHPIREDNSNPKYNLNDSDFLNFSADESVGLIRSTSSVTLDTLLQIDAKRSEEASVSVMNYSHIDPRQMMKTQQSLSFRLQNPPVYSDTAAGDLIQPGYPQSASGGIDGGVGGAGGIGGQDGGVYGMGPSHGVNLPFSPMQFQSPPPPTYETFNTAFANPPQQQMYFQPQN